MLRKIEKNAKSKEEALQMAAEEFGVPVEALSYRVEREVGKGLMGLLLGKEVIISAWITKEAEEEEARLKQIAEKRAASEQTKQAKNGGANPYAPKEEPEFKDYVGPEGRKKKSAAKEVKPQIEKPQAEKQPVAAPEKKEEEMAEPAVAETAEKPKEGGSKKKREVTEKSLKDAEYFVTELVHKMGLTDAKAEVKNTGEAVDVQVSGERMGLLIGKRGDTLDAVQYLTSLYVNKEKNSYIKVNVDTEGYRAKREETLVKLAKGLERRVVREGRAVMLEPMSPNERRIIHAALQNSTKVKTYSVGEEPRRKVVVALIDA
ncbi:RNA-binding cell elongation regulator Jag/EloR [Ructibacterium gallinarum]|uniref:RNA-binding protein KhpB n=1 Tax=Ructibacterium gallinarum TaxID=2779355 RepID=A0A9D5M2D3_9FIRM|nr:RNA-binding cell elongation regulator Jag/EloR [Ructibacterium gallinarum]MBE5040208.1 KH domain-containing protein [Ructibacterium gallinarum]